MRGMRGASGVVGALAAGSALCGAGLLAYGVRGRSARIFGPSVHRGPRDRRAIALTFDDGPSEGTPALLDVLARYQIPATFFQCGANIRRLPGAARAVRDAGHEIGNHSDTHRALYLCSAATITAEFERAQLTMEEVLGIAPRLMRAPFGARWFGFGEMQKRLGLLGVMWTVIGRDWTLDADEISGRVMGRAGNGSIICLHDGRELSVRPNIDPTLRAAERLIPRLQERGFRFVTVSQLLGLG